MIQKIGVVLRDDAVCEMAMLVVRVEVSIGEDGVDTLWRALAGAENCVPRVRAARLTQR